MDKIRPITATKYLFLALSAGLLVIAAVWYLLNVTHEPGYGDTLEYWAMSRTLLIDPWRTLAYPEILRQANRLAPVINPRVPLYALQTLVSLAAAGYLFETLFLFVDERRRRWQYRLLLPALFTALPLVAHFNLSVLTDSLALSFFLSGFAALARIFILRRATASAIIIAAASIFAAGFIRPERVVQFVAILLAASLLVILRKRYRLLLVSLLLVAVAFSTQQLNKATVNTDVGRPRPTLTYALFDRVLQGRFLELYDRMPADVRESISREDAEAWQANGLYVATIGRRLDNPAGQQVMRDAIRAALGCCAGPIIYQASGDYVEYLVAPLDYLRESVWGVDEVTSWSYWTDSRMAEAHESLTYLYIDYGFVLIVAALILFAIEAPRLWRDAAIRELLLFAGATIALTALMYTIRTGIDFHIRYALPIYGLETAFFLWGAALLLTRPSIIGDVD